MAGGLVWNDETHVLVGIAGMCRRAVLECDDGKFKFHNQLWSETDSRNGILT